MFTLVDGRNELYQWDLNRQIAVSDPDVTEVHFCNRTDDCSLVVEVKNGIADIPNILLQETWDIRVYAYCKEYTKVEERLKVKARTRPADYVYEETDVIAVRDVLVRAEAALEQAHTAVLNSEESLEKASKAVTDAEQAITTANEANEIAQTSITVVQESANQAAASAQEAKTAETEAKESANEAKTAANEAKEAKEANALNLANYYTKPEVDEAVQGAIDAIPEVDFTPYAKKTDIPTKVSQLSNDKGYLTQHQSLAGYATEKYVDDAIAGIEIPEGGGDVDLSNYYNKEEVDAAIANVDAGIFYCPIQSGKSKPAPEELLAAIDYFNRKGKVIIYTRDIFNQKYWRLSTLVDLGDGTYRIYTSISPLEYTADADGSDTGSDWTLYSNDGGNTWLTDRKSLITDLVTETELTNKGYQTAEQVEALITTALTEVENGSY